MLVTEILKAKGDVVFTVGPDDRVSQAARMLHERRVGALVVLDDGGEVAGILSERDVVRALAERGGACQDDGVATVMTRDVIFADQGETVDSLLSRMTDRRIRHLPVCEKGRLMGLVSIGDLVKSKIAETVAEAQSLKQYIAAG